MRLRTTTGAASGHAEFTVIVRGEVPEIFMVLPILDHLRDAVLGGKWFEPRQMIRVGCRVLRVIARDDGTLGLEEATAPEVWEEQVDETITDLHDQRVACTKLGFPMSGGTVSEWDLVTMHACAPAAGKLVFDRKNETPAQGMSGWRVICLDEHEHEEVVFPRLGQAMADLPYLRQFLALPPDTAVIIAPPKLPKGIVVGMVLHHGEDMTNGGIRFGPELQRGPLARARSGLVRFGDGLTRTMIGEQLGLPDVVARIALPQAAEAGTWWVQWVLDDLQDAIADGSRFVPGQTVLSGWRTLRLIDRPDGMLGLEERIADNRWAEQVDLTVRDMWSQKQVASGLGLDTWMRFPADTHLATVAECVDETVPAIVLSREATDDTAYSGWTVTCSRPHDHGVRHTRTLWDLAGSLPFVTPFLALPSPVSVQIDTPRGTGTADIRARVRLWDRELLPEPGSYTAELLGATV